MKIMITIFSLLVLSQASATVFLNNTALPIDLQLMIVDTIKKQVPCVAFYSLRETETVEREERIDQGIVDYYYTTTIDGLYYYDGYHPSALEVVVESVEYDTSNPTVQKFYITKTNLADFSCDSLF